jgi:hypothetical protein
MPIGADMPSIRQIVGIAESFGYDIDEQAAASYRCRLREDRLLALEARQAELAAMAPPQPAGWRRR